MKKEYWIIPIAALATIALLPLNLKVVPMLHLTLSDNPAVNRMAVGQLLSLGLVAVVLLLAYFVNPNGFKKYWRLGDYSAPAEKVGWLGIKDGEPWRRVGWAFALFISLGTGAFMYFGVYKNTPIHWLAALPWVLVFSLSNSFSEEMLTRFSLAAGLDGALSKQAICLWSAAIFGGVHYFGTPGGPLGVLMAGFLGWLLAKSVVETKGIGWAWFIHFLQDVVILFAFLGK